MSAETKYLQAKVVKAPRGIYVTLRSLDGSDFQFRLAASGFKAGDTVSIVVLPSDAAAAVRRMDELAITAHEQIAHLAAANSDLQKEREKLVLAMPPAAQVAKLEEEKTHLQEEVKRMSLALNKAAALVESARVFAISNNNAAGERAFTTGVVEICAAALPHPSPRETTEEAGQKVADLLGRRYFPNAREGEPGDAETYEAAPDLGGES